MTALSWCLCGLSSQDPGQASGASRACVTLVTALTLPLGHLPGVDIGESLDLGEGWACYTACVTVGESGTSVPGQ